MRRNVGQYVRFPQFVLLQIEFRSDYFRRVSSRARKTADMADVNQMLRPAITRRPLGVWAAVAVIMIFASSVGALWLATELASLF